MNHELKTSSTLAGRIWFMVMGLGLATAGAGLCVYLWMVYAKAKRMDEWVERPCRVESAEVVEAGRDRVGAPRYRVRVRYLYGYEGREHPGDRVKRLEIVGSRAVDLEKWVERFPEGTEQVCYVDPADPAMAVLKKDSKAALYAMWFPLLFVMGGLGIAAGAVRGGAGSGGSALAVPADSDTTTAASGGVRQ